MKQKFSNKWKASKQPRKQRKYRANAPLNVRHKMMSVNFSKELRKKYGKRNFPVKKGDNVKIMKGEFKSKTGKVEIVDLKRLRIVIDGISRTKKDGAKVNVYFDPSNLQIKELNLEDIKRKKGLERKEGKKKVEGEGNDKKTEMKNDEPTGNAKVENESQSKDSENERLDLGDTKKDKTEIKSKEDKKENASK